MKHLSYGGQCLDEEDVKAVLEAVRNKHLTQGPTIAEFEEKLASACGARYAVAVNSGTSALHIACLAAGVGEGDEVITSPITFVASANCAFYCGAKPVFADIISETALIDPIEVAKKMNRNTKAVIPVHFAGQSADMAAIQKLSTEHSQKTGKKVFIIEDAAHALGATYKDSKVGSCEYSDMTILSFHPVKHITTLEGGAVLTNDKNLYERLSLFRSHGITRDSNVLESQEFLPWGYEQVELGFNYRITDVQCALGLSQLKKLPKFLEKRREMAERYRKELNGLEIEFLKNNADSLNAYHLFVILLEPTKRQSVLLNLRERGIFTQVHYIPVHTQPYFKKKLNTKWGDFPKAEAYFRKCLSIPLFPAMSNDDFDRVVSELKLALKLPL